MKLSIICIAILSFAFYHNATSQRYLVLRKVGRPYRIIFEEGQSMRFKMKGERFFTEALIQGFGEDDIRFHYYRIKLDEIAEVDVSEKNFTVFSFRSGPGKLVFAGFLYMAGEQVNQTLVQDESFGISTSTAIVSGSLIGSGFLLKAIQKKRFKMKKKRHVMEIVDFRPK